MNKSLKDIMISDPYSLTQNSMSVGATRLLVEHRINCIPVVDKTNTIVDILTSYDILERTI
jgi:CBS domain-containing protein